MSTKNKSPKKINYFEFKNQIKNRDFIIYNSNK